jgi:hypothetical protein
MILYPLHAANAMDRALTRDFKADARKQARNEDGFGLGDFRYFMVPAGLVKPEELPARWGLLEVSPGSGFIRHAVKAKHIPSNKHAECELLPTGINRYRYEIERSRYERHAGARFINNLQGRVDDEVLRWLFLPGQDALRKRLVKSGAQTWSAIGNTSWDVAAKLMEHLKRSLRPPGTPDMEQRELFEMCLDFTLNTLVNWNTIVHMLKTRSPAG